MQKHDFIPSFVIEHKGLNNMYTYFILSMVDKIDCVKIKLDDKHYIVVNKKIHDVLSKKIRDNSLLNSILAEFDELKELSNTVNDHVVVDDVVSTDDSNDSNDKVKRKPKKTVAYKKERDELVNKLNKILGICEDKAVIVVSNITEDMEKQIEALIPNIKLYFAYGHWNYFKENRANLVRPILSLIKCIYRDTNHQVTQSVSYKKIKGESLKFTVLMISKKS